MTYDMFDDATDSELYRRRQQQKQSIRRIAREMGLPRSRVTVRCAELMAQVSGAAWMARVQHEHEREMQRLRRT